VCDPSKLCLIMDWTQRSTACVQLIYMLLLLFSSLSTIRAGHLWIASCWGTTPLAYSTVDPMGLLSSKTGPFTAPCTFTLLLIIITVLNYYLLIIGKVLRLRLQTSEPSLYIQTTNTTTFDEQPLHWRDTDSDHAVHRAVHYLVFVNATSEVASR